MTNKLQVWFPGTHTDIGGGIAPEQTPRKYGCTAAINYSLRSMVRHDKDTYRRKAPQSALQLSDIALKWMIDELDMIPGQGIKWNYQKNEFLEHYRHHVVEVVDSWIHDALRLGEDKALALLFWQVMGKSFHCTGVGAIRLTMLSELLPLRRWRYSAGEWKITRIPNLEGCRDLPPGSILHKSLIERLVHDDFYLPRNKVWAKNAARSLRLDRVNKEVVREAEPHRTAQSTSSKPVYSLSSSPEPPIKARFELHTSGNASIGQDEEDDTYIVVMEETIANATT